jgi:hypothetical protein
LDLLKGDNMQKFILGFILISFSLLGNPKKDVLHYFKLVNKSQPMENFQFTEKDIKNGYLKYDIRGAEGFNEFAIWFKKDKTVIAANVSYGCGPACGVNDVKFYEFNDDNPQDTTSKFYPEAKLQALYKKKLDKAQAKKAFEDESYWLKIPRKGTTIEIGIKANQMSDKETFIPVADLVFKKDTFELVEKK